MKKLQLGTLLGGLVAATLFAACIPLFTGGLFQTLRLSFRLDRALAAGEAHTVHTAVFREDVKVRKNFVQLSGRLTPADGDEPPARVTVTAVIENLDSGKVIQRIQLRLDPEADGSFEANARIRKNIAAGEMMSVTVEPSDRELGAGAELTLCVDLVRARGELAALPDCLPADSPDDPGGGVDPDATFSSIDDDYFKLVCSQSGCHSASSARAGLVLENAQAYANLVRTSSSQRPELNRVTPGDPDNSYLVKKLRGDGDIVGQRMPFGGPFLTDAEINRVVRWIQDGALDN